MEAGVKQTCMGQSQEALEKRELDRILVCDHTLEQKANDNVQHDIRCEHVEDHEVRIHPPHLFYSLKAKRPYAVDADMRPCDMS